MEQSEKDQLIGRLNIVIQQRNSFLDQIVILQEQIDKLTKQLDEANKKIAELTPSESQDDHA